MKIKEKLNEITTTQRNLAKILGLTPERIRQLTLKGIIIRDASDDSGGVYLIESLQRYYKQAVESVEYDKEHALLEQIKRQTAELKLQKARGELYEADVVEQVMTQDFNKIRTQLLSLPMKLATELEGKTKSEISTILIREIHNTLQELSTYSSNLFMNVEENNEES